MNEEELIELIQDCPKLYHMAENGSWPSIEKHGLLSTSALLDLFGIKGNSRSKIESTHRPTSTSISGGSLSGAVIRDQMPMSNSGLMKALPSNITPRDWYRLLNSKVFFWLTKDRLFRLTSAKAYKNKQHDVLEICTSSLVAAHKERLWLCPINSGCTKPFPHKRDFNTFSRISTYQYQHWKQKRKAGERVVELAVDYEVKDILKHVTAVYKVRQKEIISRIY